MSTQRRPPPSPWLQQKLAESQAKAPTKSVGPNVQIVGSMRLRPGAKPRNETFALIFLLDFSSSNDFISLETKHKKKYLTLTNCTQLFETICQVRICSDLVPCAQCAPQVSMPKHSQTCGGFTKIDFAKSAPQGFCQRKALFFVETFLPRNCT